MRLTKGMLEIIEYAVEYMMPRDYSDEFEESYDLSQLTTEVGYEDTPENRSEVYANIKRTSQWVREQLAKREKKGPVK